MNRLIIIIGMLFFFAAANAQIREKDNLLGGSIGLWAKGNSPVLGASFESQVTGTTAGTLGIGGLARFYNLNDNYSNGDSRAYTFTSLGFQTNFNFNNIGDGKFVPYLGLVVGYNNVSNSYIKKNGNIVYDETYTSGAWVWGQLGARYFFSNSVAGSLRLGIGNNDFYPLEIGVDFKL